MKKDLQDKKPKHRIKEAAVFANIAVIGLLVITAAVCLLVLRRSAYSETERRPLAKFPQLTLKTWFTGDFADGVTTYFSDTVPDRDRLKQLGAVITKYKGIPKDGVIIVDSGNHGSGSNMEDSNTDLDEIQIAPNKPSSPDGNAAETPAAPAQTPDRSENGGELLYSGNGLVIVGNRAMEIFGGSLRVAKTYALNLNAYKEALGNRVNVYSMVIPVASAFYYKEGSSRSDCISVIRTVSESLSGDVTDIPVFDVLDRLKDEYLYFRTDHHWTALAGYYAWCEFAARAEIDVPALDSSAYEAAKKPDYLGSLYGQTGSHTALKNDPDTFRYYKPTNRYTVAYRTPDGAAVSGTSLFYEDLQRDFYMTVMGANEKIAEIKTDVKNGRKLAIVKDSFGNMLVPFAVTAFEEIYVVDARYFEMNLIEYLQLNGVTDVLFACCAFQASSSTPVGNTYVDNIQEIRIR